MFVFVGKKTLIDSFQEEEEDNACFMQQNAMDLPSLQHVWSYGTVGACGDFVKMA